MSETKIGNNFGDLYMSIADYSYFESIDFEYTFYLDLLFRRHIYVEESVFFLKDHLFSDLALKPKGHIHAAIREGIIRPLTKGTEGSSFEELASRYPHLRLNNPALRPETMQDDIVQVAKLYDRMYSSDGHGIKTRAISLDEAKYYNQDLKKFLQSSEPLTTSGTLRQVSVLQKTWQETEAFRFDWIDQIVRESEIAGLASAPKTDFNKLGARTMGIPYKDLKQLIDHAPHHPQGAQIIAFLRWVHEIFYFSRSRAISAATTYALKPDHVAVPLLCSGTASQTDGAAFDDNLSAETAIRLPTRQSLTTMSSSQLLGLRESEEATDFYQAMLCWQLRTDTANKKELLDTLSRYTAKICEAAGQSNQHAIMERLVRIDNGSIKALLGTLSVLGAVTTFVNPLHTTNSGLQTMATAAAGLSGAIVSLSFFSEKAARHLATRPAKALLYNNQILDIDAADNLISC